MFLHFARPLSFPALTVALFLILGANADAQLGLKLPTQNDKIFSDDPSEFYMYTYRNFEGQTSKPWSAGRYGFVRDQKRTNSGMIFTKFHEGIDIKPVSRDSSGNPLDIVNAIMAGTVVYVNASASTSSYGKYVVVVHDQGFGPFFSLYAHLSAISATIGQRVEPGTPLGQLGYTGAGINRERAHVHLELTMLLSDRFQTWYDKHYTSRNHHGIYSGFNLTGLDIAALYHAHKANPAITIPEFISRLDVYFKVTVPQNGNLEIAKRYPWLLKRGSGNVGWEIAFSAEGVPVSITPTSKSVTYPAVTWVKPLAANHSYNTRGYLTGTGDKATLSGSGSQYVQLLTGAF